MHLPMRQQLNRTLIITAILLALRPVSSSSNAERQCTVDTIDAENLTVETFLEDYYLKKPLIVRHVGTAEHLRELWNIHNLVKNHGEVRVAIGTSSDLTRDSGSGKSQTTLAELANVILAETKDNVEHFAFERNPELFTHEPRLINNIFPAALMTSLNRTKKNVEIDWYFSFGSFGSGVHMHHHTDGFALIHEGTKRFFFLEPWSQLPAITHRARFPMKEWLGERVHPKLHKVELPLECEAMRGDLVYVAEGWWHATIVESDFALAVAGQLRKPASEAGKLWRDVLDLYQQTFTTRKGSMKRQNSRHAKKLIEETLSKVQSMTRLKPGCAEAWHFAGLLAGRLNRPATWEKTMEELRLKQKAYVISQRNCDVAHNYAISLMKARRLDDANAVLVNATKLCGTWQAQLWAALSKLHELQGKLVASRLARQKADEIHETEL